LPQLTELALGRPEPVASPATAEGATPPAATGDRAKAGRTYVAALQDSAAFGKMVAAKAYRRQIDGAEQGALLGAGGACIWALHDRR
jgi:hypothetical protein